MKLITTIVLAVLLMGGPVFADTNGPVYAGAPSIAGTGTEDVAVSDGKSIEAFVTCVSGGLQVIAMKYEDGSLVQVYPLAGSDDAYVTVIAGETMPFRGKIDVLRLTSTDAGGSDAKVVSYF